MLTYSHPTYEELKQKGARFEVWGNRDSHPTYEELKHFIKDYQKINLLDSHPTYEELKQNKYSLFFR